MSDKKPLLSAVHRADVRESVSARQVSATSGAWPLREVTSSCAKQNGVGYLGVEFEFVPCVE